MLRPSSARTRRCILGPLFVLGDVAQSRRRFGLWLLLDLIGSRVHFVVHAIVDLLLGVIVENAQLLELMRERRDRVFGGPRLHLFASSIATVIVIAGVRHQAVGFRLY